MPIKKFTTDLDLARQAEIFSGETAVFQGGIQVGIPFSQFPSGVDESSAVSLGIVLSETAIMSGNTGTTVFDVSNPLSPSYDPSFDSFSANTWTEPIFQIQTPGVMVV